MRFNVTLSPKDLSTLNGEYCWRWKNVWPSVATVIFVFIAVAAVTIGLGQAAIYWGIGFPPPLDFAVTIAIAFLALRVSQSFLIAKSSGASNSIYEPTSYQVSDEGLRTSAPSSEMLVRWSAFQEVVLGRKAAYLGLGLNRAIIVPRRAFADSREFEQFIKFCQEKIGA